MGKVVPINRAVTPFWIINLSGPVIDLDLFVSEKHLYESLDISISPSGEVTVRPRDFDVEKVERAIEVLRECPYVESIIPPGEHFKKYELVTFRRDTEVFLAEIQLALCEFLLQHEVKLFIDGGLKAMATPRGARWLTMLEDVSAVNLA